MKAKGNFQEKKSFCFHFYDKNFVISLVKNEKEKRRKKKTSLEKV